MSMELAFQLNKVSRFIKSYGNVFTFTRYGKNEFGELVKDGTNQEDIEVVGVYHEVNSYVSFVTSEGTVTKTVPQPMILCMPDEGAKLAADDELWYNGTHYKVVDPANIAKAGFCIDVSLEVIQDG